MILPALEHFSNLTTLYVPGLRRTLNQLNAAAAVGNILKSLPSLHRLALCGNELSRCLRTVLEPLVRPLTVLRLNDCNLGNEDWIYLAESRHADTVEELDVGRNDIRSNQTAFFRFVERLSTSIISLELERVQMNSIQLHQLSKECSRARRLHYVDVSDNRSIGHQSILRALENLCLAPALEWIVCGLPLNFIATPMEDSRVDVLARKTSRFRDSLSTRTDIICRKLRRSPVAIVVKRHRG